MGVLTCLASKAERSQGQQGKQCEGPHGVRWHCQGLLLGTALVCLFQIQHSLYPP